MPWLVVLRVAAAVALAASGALLSDYVADSPSFCRAASGCGAVRNSSLSHLRLSDGTFIPLPVFGLAGFAVLFGASLLSRRLTLVAAVVGGGAGLYLLSVQALVLRQFCWLCVTTDVSAVIAAVAAVAAGRSWHDQARSRLRPQAWWALGALAIAAPLLWPKLKPTPPVPAGVLAHYQLGKLNVVEFADFECPACRRFAGILKDGLAAYAGQVHFVRLHKPLAMHAFAHGAARAAVCAEAQGQAEPMAEALFASDDLSPSGIQRLAQALSLDSSKFQSCLLDPATYARVDRESALLVPPELEGLPTTYIGGKRLLGVQSPEVLADALARAARGEGSVGVPGYVYLPIVALIGLLIVRLGARRTDS